GLSEALGEGAVGSDAMFPLPVANGKNRPTTLASTQFGGSGIMYREKSSRVYGHH
uniref:Uncharacterized protein n=1 Tax=Meleagris gallopavo TaxID=9103 RepID=A0A803YBF8_MELGA